MLRHYRHKPTYLRAFEIQLTKNKLHRMAVNLNYFLDRVIIVGQRMRIHIRIYYCLVAKDDIVGSYWHPVRKMDVFPQPKSHFQTIRGNLIALR